MQANVIPNSSVPGVDMTEVISGDLSDIKSDIKKAIALAKSGTRPNPPVTQYGFDKDQVIHELKQISTGDPAQISGSIAKLITRLSDSPGEFLGHSVPEMPSVLFHRIPKLPLPIVNIQAIEEAVLADTQVEGLEGFLDQMFSNDQIYDDVIRQLRQQVIALHKRNSLLENNLDSAELEVEYWRDNFKNDKPLRATSPPLAAALPAINNERKISVKAWKLSISKFIGSIDQFALMKALFIWRTHVYQNRINKRNSQ